MTVVLDRAAVHAQHTELTPVSWFPGTELAYDEWLRQGARLGLAGRSAGWWIGDWVRYGTARYGSKYTAAARVTGYDRQTMMNMVYVATRFEFSRRRENLSWSHHAELAALAVDEQDRWLSRALEQRLSVRDLRELLLADERPRGRSRSRRDAARGGAASASALEQVPGGSRSQAPEAAPSGDGAAERAVVCPHCGHQFVA
jgi:hypothetical protein